jgi:hypothetical protein
MSYISILKNRAKNINFWKKNQFILDATISSIQYFKPILLIL